MHGCPDGDRVKPGARQQRQPAVAAAPQDEGQRARPEPVSHPTGTIVEDGEGIRLGQTGHMDDQRVEARPFLGSEDRSDRALVGRIPTEPIDRLGRKGDELPAAQ